MAQSEKALPDNIDTDRRDTSSANAFRRSIFGVPVTVTVSVGRRRMSVSELLELRPESVVALDSHIDDPVDLTVDNKTIAKGELIETEDGTLAVKIIEIPDQTDD